jgi:DNA mismatch repair ATPase MutS
MFENKNFTITNALCSKELNLTPALELQQINCLSNLVSDLELEQIISPMSQGDKLISNISRAAFLQPLQTVEEVKYRQAVLQDALENPETVRRIYNICLETEKEKNASWSWLTSHFVSSTYHNAIDLLQIYLKMLGKLRGIADSEIHKFSSSGFTTMFALLQRELSDTYLQETKDLLASLSEEKGVLISAKFGCFLQSSQLALRKKNMQGFRLRWWLSPSYTLAKRDDKGAQDLSNRIDRATNESANALAQAAEHLESFFAMLGKEIAFYVGCLNLDDTLRSIGMPICLPIFNPKESNNRTWQELYDVSLTLVKKNIVVGTELLAAHKNLYVITGANQGGKSTLLRSIGQAQVMGQCGMFVCAEKFVAPLRQQVFTHFKKAEDVKLNSGKLDEELTRMSMIADCLEPYAMILFNEAFASTNEREGSEIGRQITAALLNNAMEVFSVTHLYDYAVSFRELANVEYLQAQRASNSVRSFKIVRGEPEKTAYGEDLYEKIFKKELAICKN